MTLVSTFVVGITGLLGLAITAEGVNKFNGAHVEDFERFGYPPWFRLTTGTLEFLGGIALLAGLVQSTAALVGGVVIAAVLVGAVATHVRVGDSASATAPAAVMLVLTLGILVYYAGLTV